MSKNTSDLVNEIDAILSGNDTGHQIDNLDLVSEIEMELGSNIQDSLITTLNENTSLIGLEQYSKTSNENETKNNENNNENNND